MKSSRHGKDGDGNKLQNKEQSPKAAKQIWLNYESLFHTILPSVVRQYHKEADYWAPSSASEGRPEEYTHGDTHYWGVWWGKEPFDNFNMKISSFMSEYGFQSFPEYASFQKICKETGQKYLFRGNESTSAFEYWKCNH